MGVPEPVRRSRGHGEHMSFGRVPDKRCRECPVVGYRSQERLSASARRPSPCGVMRSGAVREGRGGVYEGAAGRRGGARRGSGVIAPRAPGMPASGRWTRRLPRRRGASSATAPRVCPHRSAVRAEGGRRARRALRARRGTRAVPSKGTAGCRPGPGRRGCRPWCPARPFRSCAHAGEGPGSADAGVPCRAAAPSAARPRVCAARRPAGRITTARAVTAAGRERACGQAAAAGAAPPAADARPRRARCPGRVRAAAPAGRGPAPAASGALRSPPARRAGRGRRAGRTRAHPGTRRSAMPGAAGRAGPCGPGTAGIRPSGWSAGRGPAHGAREPRGAHTAARATAPCPRRARRAACGSSASTLIPLSPSTRVRPGIPAYAVRARGTDANSVAAAAAVAVAAAAVATAAGAALGTAGRRGVRPAAGAALAGVAPRVPLLARPGALVLGAADLAGAEAVSYTHLTLPTNREV